MVATSNASNRRCEATNARGEPCGAWAMHGSRYCYFHDPAMAVARRQSNAKGGKARQGRVIGPADPTFVEEVGHRHFRTLADIVAMLEVAIRQTLVLENSIRRNRTLGYLARCFADVYETGELERRLEDVEARLAAQAT
jgi:hypothetical protein